MEVKPNNLWSNINNKFTFVFGDVTHEIKPLKVHMNKFISNITFNVMKLHSNIIFLVLFVIQNP
jgi:hypothetical protein